MRLPCYKLRAVFKYMVLRTLGLFINTRGARSTLPLFIIVRDFSGLQSFTHYDKMLIII